jgi:hypothetical protein
MVKNMKIQKCKCGQRCEQIGHWDNTIEPMKRSKQCCRCELKSNTWMTPLDLCEICWETRQSEISVLI